MAGSTESVLRSLERVMVAPSQPSPKAFLQLSTLDNLPGVRENIFNTLLVYNASDRVSADPAKVIRQALSKVLVYYSPFAGRLRKKENGDLEVECTGEGALFVEAMADTDLSVLGDLDDYSPSLEQLLFCLPPDTDIEDIHPLVVQVTRFTCGGFVVGVSFCHGICDGLGAGQFLIAMGEMARGEIKPSSEPIWKRELLKPEDPLYRFQYYHFRLIRPSSTFGKIVQGSFVITSETINCIKQCLREESKEFCSAFEVVSALAWIARTRALQIPHSENVKLIFAMDMRKLFNPPLSKGYYGNFVGTVCAMDNVKDLLSGSLLRVVRIIKKAKVSLNEHFTSTIVTPRSGSDESINYENIVGFGDRRRLGFDEVDFGWGHADNVSLVQHGLKDVSVVQSYFLFIRPPKNNPDGIKILSFMPPLIMKSFKFEMETMTNKYVTKP
uniref:10-deacetylbaccatin III-10-O-acetyl transferase n=1 Tax=Taxus baccata TaxID=25629 RepID=M9V211_TAXBA|nr:10-deacetylbaccatin III-10-O-acetyl transferase [Taxus baccata]